MGLCAIIVSFSEPTSKSGAANSGMFHIYFFLLNALLRANEQMLSLASSIEPTCSHPPAKALRWLTLSADGQGGPGLVQGADGHKNAHLRASGFRRPSSERGALVGARRTTKDFDSRTGTWHLATDPPPSLRSFLSSRLLSETLSILYVPVCVAGLPLCHSVPS